MNESADIHMDQIRLITKKKKITYEISYTSELIFLINEIGKQSGNLQMTPLEF